jgi:ammonia channel protein AmtB
MLRTLYNQRDASYTMFFIIIGALYVSGGFSAHHQELIKLCAALGIVTLSCYLPLVWMVWNKQWCQNNTYNFVFCTILQHCLDRLLTFYSLCDLMPT